MLNTPSLPLLPGPLCPGILALDRALSGTNCLLMQRGKTPSMSLLDTTQDNLMMRLKMLELWRMRSNPSSPWLPGPLWPGLVAPDRALFMGQIELNCVILIN